MFLSGDSDFLLIGGKSIGQTSKNQKKLDFFISTTKHTKNTKKLDCLRVFRAVRGSEKILQFMLAIQVIILASNPRMDDLVIDAMAGLRIKNAECQNDERQNY
jgi:hypothetical protein